MGSLITIVAFITSLFITSFGKTSDSYLYKELKEFIAFINNKTTVLAQEAYPQFISGKAITYTSADTTVAEIKSKTYIIATGTSTLQGQINIGTVSYKGTTFIVARKADGSVNSIYLIPQGTSSEALIYYEAHSDAQDQDTLKLDTFIPPEVIIPLSFTYEWYTPACKPAIYLYPEEETKLSVKLKPQGNITRSDPLYITGWNNFFAKPNGEILVNGIKYPYLYYEANINEVKVPKTGWVVQRELLPSFFTGILTLSGLNDKEITDFNEYWVKKLNDKPYYFITLLNKDYLDQIERIEFSKKPDTFIRVRFFFEGLDKETEVSPMLLPDTPERKGFVAVDWGGMIAKGTCENDTSSNQIIE